MRAWHLTAIMVVAICWWTWLMGTAEHGTGQRIEADPIPAGTTRSIQLIVDVGADGAWRFTADKDGENSQTVEVACGLGPIAYAEVLGPTRRPDGSWEYVLRFHAHYPDPRTGSLMRNVLDAPSQRGTARGSRDQSGTTEWAMPAKAAAVRLSEEYVVVYSDQKRLQSITQTTGDGKPMIRPVYAVR